MLLTTLVDQVWTMHIANGDCTWLDVTSESEPRVPTYTAKQHLLAYVGADGNIYEINLATQNSEILLHANNSDSYTHLAYDQSGQALFVVVLKSGSSADSDIAVWRRADGLLKPLVVQRSAQFEPFHGDDDNLYYGNVSCTVECGGVIQDIWRFGLTSGRAEQLTMLNAVSRQPFYHKDGNQVLFSSNKSHHFHIWAKTVSDSPARQLTDGKVTDFHPVVVEQSVYFLRKTAMATNLMRLGLNAVSKPEVIPLGFVADDIKELRYGGM